MKWFITFIITLGCMPLSAMALESQRSQAEPAAKPVVWEKGINIETFWMVYANSKGGLTWGKSETYPEYEKVKEGDTILIQLKQGPCLMEFFHSRWRRANDVRRWDDSVNDYGGCPTVFDD